MSVEGKSKNDWCAVTLCDFGEPGRRDVISRHFFMETALRGFKRINQVYGRAGWNCWQEDRERNVIQGERPPAAVFWAEQTKTNTET
ncbi:hypothetical protein EBZ39_00315 [bacterium]|nr:hypothetical protein [bacterium]